jgi:uncharacterized membrane protein
VNPLIDCTHNVLQNSLYKLSLVWPCHQIRSRSLSVRGRQTPLCARCMGLLLGPALVPVWLVFVPPSVSLLAIAAFMLDAVTQALGWRESRNSLRFATGAGFAAAAVSLLWVSFHAA